MNKPGPYILAALDLVIELVIASVLFVVIAGLAVGLDKFLLFFITWASIPEKIAEPLKAAKYLVFLLDLAIYIMFLLGALKSAWRKLWK